MEEAGDFYNLPLLAMDRVLFYLHLEDLKNTRTLSSWFEARVTLLKTSIFGTFRIITNNKTDCPDIRKTLLKAMEKPNAYKQKLELFFFDEYTDIMKDILMTYMEYITVLDIKMTGYERFLLSQDLKLDLLKNLSIRCCVSNDRHPSKVVTIFESLVERHFTNLVSLRLGTIQTSEMVDKLTLPDLDNLKSLELISLGAKAIFSILKVSSKNITSLKIRSLKFNVPYLDDDDLIIPPMPELDYLGLESLDTKAVFSFVAVCRQTISTLQIMKMNLCTSFLNYIEATNSEKSHYYIPNLEHMTLKHEFPFDFVKVNASNLVSLTLYNVPNYRWPGLPKLRELSLNRSEYLSILKRCNLTLECLVYKSSYKSIDEFVVEMPLLTDFNAFSSNSYQKLNCSKFLVENHHSLEFVSMAGVNPFPENDSPNDVVKMNNIKTVLMIGAGWNTYSELDRQRMVDMCPNAEVFLMDYHKMKSAVKSRWRMKGFKLEMHF